MDVHQRLSWGHNAYKWMMHSYWGNNTYTSDQSKDDILAFMIENVDRAEACLQRCSGSDLLLGAAPMWLSVIILVLIGFVVGSVTGFLLALKRQQKMIRHTGPDLSSHLEDQASLQTGQLTQFQFDGVKCPAPKNLDIFATDLFHVKVNRMTTS